MKSGHCYWPVVVPTCAAMWPDGRRHENRRSPWSHHAIVDSPCCSKPQGLSSNRRSSLTSDRHGSSRQWLPLLPGRKLSSPKFGATALEDYKLSAPLAPLSCYEARAPALASDHPPQRPNLGFPPNRFSAPPLASCHGQPSACWFMLLCLVF
jgi:hypothetical protein